MKLSNWISKLGRGEAPNGERIRSADAFRDAGNGYFRKIGQYFKTAQILLFVLLFLFVTIFVIANSESVTYENLYYFFKDFQIAVDNTDSSVEAIPYDTDSNMTFATYKGGLAVAGTERIRLMTAAGRINSTSVLGFASPALSSTTDLLLVYARGENDCHIYNSFTKIHEEKLEGAIRTAYLSESGAYSVTTEDGEYESVVLVYGRNFEKRNKYNLNSYVIAAPLSDDGKTIAMLSYVCENGTYETRVRLAKVGSDQILCDASMSGEFPLGISFADSDSVLVLTDGGLYRVTPKSGSVRATEWTDGYVGTFSLGTNGAILVLRDDRKGTSDTIAISDEDGAILRYVEAQDTVLSVQECENYIFYRTDSELVRISVKTGECESLPCIETGGTLLAVSENTVLICQSGEAKYYRFRKA